MKIAVLGAGPIGASLAGFLKMQGEEVWLIDPVEEIIIPIQEKGLTFYVSNSFDETAEVTKYETAIDASIVPDGIGIMDVVVVAVKGFDTRGAIESIRLLADGHTLILSTQNGLGNADILEEVFPGQVGYGVIVLAGNHKEDEPGAYSMTMYTKTIHLPVTSRHERMVPVLESLEATLKETPYNLVYMDVAKVDKLLWKKLCLNIVVNPINSIHEGPMDALFALPQGIELSNMVIEEALAVAKAKGIELTREQIRLVPMEVQRKLPANGHRHYTSMCMDVIHHRRVENEFLSGAVVREGKKLGIPTPYNETLSLLMQIIENTYEDRYKDCTAMQ